MTTRLPRYRASRLRYGRVALELGIDRAARTAHRPASELGPDDGRPQRGRQLAARIGDALPSFNIRDIDLPGANGRHAKVRRIVTSEPWTRAADKAGRDSQRWSQTRSRCPEARKIVDPEGHARSGGLPQLMAGAHLSAYRHQSRLGVLRTWRPKAFSHGFPDPRQPECPQDIDQHSS